MKAIKNILLCSLFLAHCSLLNAQNIDDNKVNFSYIQLPAKKIDSSWKTFKVLYNHLYKDANNDSLKIFDARKQQELTKYNADFAVWKQKKDALDKDYFTKMAAYEKSVNSGAAATKPTDPIYPVQPVYNPNMKILQHSELLENQLTGKVQMQGYDSGDNGLLVLIDIYPMRGNKLVERKTGSGASTKYEFLYQYILPIGLTVTKTDGTVLYKQILLDNERSELINKYSSRYEWLLWMVDHEATLFQEMELRARNYAFSEVNRVLNDQFGFINTSRETEVYSIKRYKDYEYSDVTEAYTLTTQALAMVSKDRNRATAIPKLEAAIAKWKSILQESNLYDEKARINDKITAMIHCNLSELYIWKGDFATADLELNLALNSGVFKFKNESERRRDFFNFQKARWEAQNQ
ncbi:MAG: hypothetical protein LW688_00365 [Cryomorphaceae bacterium]|jgi:hypothetical protein|nr:hypothetical protein [Cryomorphaceae bacterium]